MGENNRGFDQARARFAIQTVAFVLGIAPDEVESTRRGRAHAAFARHIAMYLSHVAFEMSLSRVAYAFGRDRSTVSYACHQIEDRRDDRDFDDWVGELEELVSQAPTLRVAGWH